MPNPTFTLTFNCKLENVFSGDNVYIRTHANQFTDPEYPDYVIARVIGYTPPSNGVFCGKKVHSYVFEAISALPSGVNYLQNCDVEGIRLSQSCCLVSGSWVGDELHFIREDGSKLIVPPAQVSCSFDDADFNPDVELPAI